MNIVLNDIVKTFGKLTVVDHVSITIKDGEFFTLLGPSGCGKTTLLRMIAGFNNPDSGDIYFGKESVVSVPAHRRGAGMVFQNYALFPHLNVTENVAYGLHARNMPAQEIQSRVASMLEAVQLNGMGTRFPRQLSGGQQQRVALARALVIQPRVLLMDEPLSNLDAKLRVTMREEIRRMQKEFGITTIYVTHDQEEAMAVSDRIAILYGGILQQVDKPTGIYFSPVNRFTAEFMGSCNIFEMQGQGYDASTGLCTARMGEHVFSLRVSDPDLAAPLLVMLRPDWIEENHEGITENAFTGIVRDSTFLGTAVVYQVEVLGRMIRVDVPALHGYSFKSEGDIINLTFKNSSPVLVRP